MKRLFPAIIFLALIFSGFSAFATLGGYANSVDTDMQAVAGTQKSVQNFPLYSIQTISSSHIILNEYVSKDGTIFGISWRGTHHPDLVPLLGTYLNDYSASLKTNEARRFRGARVVTKTQTVIVEKAGHLRAMKGRAFVPGLLPSGVSDAEIK